MSGASRAGSVRLPPLAPAVLAAAEQVDKIRPSRVGIDQTVMTTGKLTARRRQFLTALVCLETSLVVALAQGRDRASAARS